MPKREWNNCFIKNNQAIFSDLADLALQEQQEDNLMVAISPAWYSCSYTMATKPIKSLELRYTTIRFLIKYGQSLENPAGGDKRQKFPLSDFQTKMH